MVRCGGPLQCRTLWDEDRRASPVNYPRSFTDFLLSNIAELQQAGVIAIDPAAASQTQSLKSDSLKHLASEVTCPTSFWRSEGLHDCKLTCGQLAGETCIPKGRQDLVPLWPMLGTTQINPVCRRQHEGCPSLSGFDGY